MVAASGFLGAGIQHRERKENECSRRVGPRNQILHTQTRLRKYQWDICMHRYSVVNPPGTVARQRTSRPQTMSYTSSSTTAHHVLPAAISYPPDHWPASDDPCRILPVIDQVLVSAAANNKIKQSVLSKQSTSCKRSYAPCEASSRLPLRQCTSRMTQKTRGTGGVAGSAVGRSCCSFSGRICTFIFHFADVPPCHRRGKSEAHG